MYDPGFPFPRSWLYGLGGFFCVAAALAIGIVIARPGEVEQRTPIVADRPADEVLVVRAAPERATVFPAFAPEGVIVVDAPSATQHASAAPETMTSERRVESARRRARLYERPPVAAARADASLSRTPETEASPDEANQNVVDEPSQDIEPAQNEAPPARVYEEASNNEASEAAPDNRSWYGSEDYQREVQERRRARRRAQ